MAIRFRTSLLLVFLSLLGLTLVATLYSVISATDVNARANAERELEVAERVVETLLDDNRCQLTDRTTLLAEDFGFKQAIATNEEDTVISVLANHGDRIGAELIVLATPEGEVEISTHDLQATETLRTELAANNSPFGLLMIAEGAAYQLVMVPVRAPLLIAWVGMGFELDRALLEGFRDITKAEMTLLYRESAVQTPQLLSTMAPDHPEPVQRSTLADWHASLEAHWVDSGWLNRTSWPLDTQQQQLALMVSVSLNEALAAYQPLQMRMLGIGLVALLLAAVAAAYIARRITRPIAELVGAARRIGRGDYNAPLTLQRKDEFGVLSDTLNTMQGAIREREQHIVYQARHDLLTGLPNREQISDTLATTLNERTLSGELVLVELSNFDALSDVYGMAVLDDVVREFARRLQQYCGPDDVLGRVESNEFLLLRPEPERSGAPQALVGQLLTLFEPPIQVNEIDIKAELRLGLLRFPDQGDTADDALRRVHIALRDARRDGQLWQRYRDDRDRLYLRTLQVTHRLQQAINSGGFQLLYQPQYDMARGIIHSCEALIRWHDSELGPMYPDEFIPLAEQSGVITRITEWVLDEALLQMQRWQLAGLDMGVSINLSAHDILATEFVESLIARIESDGIRKDRLILEITESAMMTDTQKALSNLQKLYDAGLYLAMDDFGTGFSSLAQLKRIPIHELKIDKSFVLHMDTDADDQRIVLSTIEMAHHLGLSVIAEGVENQASLNLLKEMGCNAAQGYFFSKPMPLAELTPWVKAFHQQENTHA
ncbi:MAG: putative bifunctional diguanylate cyclase/phosphodiesterase [Saccharospirillum sp.]